MVGSLHRHRQWLRWTRAHKRLNTGQTRRGLRGLFWDGVLSQAMDVLVGGAFITAFALLAGANHFEIGVIAALSPISQLLQLPAVKLVNMLGRRKLVTVVSSVFSRGVLVPLAAIPLLLPIDWTLWPVILFLLVYYALAAISGCSFNSWIRDLVPERLMGRFFSMRTAFSIATGVVVSLVASGFVDVWQWVGGKDSTYLAYCIVFFVAAFFGLASVLTIVIMPEPRIHRRRGESFLKMIQTPLRDKQFRPALVFLFAWTLAINIPGPFYAVYMLQRLDMALFLVIVFSQVAQFANVLALPTWGRLADKYGNRAVMTVAGQIFAVSLLVWPFTTMPDVWIGTWPLLIVIHLLMGFGGAGMTLCMNNMALALSPKSKATEYMACSELNMGAAGFIGPLVGGGIAAVFATTQIAIDIDIKLTEHGASIVQPAFSAEGLDLLFLLGLILCAVALFFLFMFKRPEDVHQAEVFSAFRDGMTQTVVRLPTTTEHAFEQAREVVGEQMAGMVTTGDEEARRKGMGNRIKSGLEMAGMLSALNSSTVLVMPKMRRASKVARSKGWPLFVYMLTGVPQEKQQDSQASGDDKPQPPASG